MNRDLATALTLDRALRMRTAAEVIPFPGGVVVRDDGRPDVRYVNAVVLDAAGPRLDVAAVNALAERRLGDREHRHVVFDDADAGERLTDGLSADGWARERTLFMAFAADPATVTRDPRAREVSDAEARTLEEVSLAEEVLEADVRSGLVARLMAVAADRRAGTGSRRFAAGEENALQSLCTLFLESDAGGRRVAMIESVGTVIAHRRRGLARAVVSEAVAAADAWGAELILVPVDADDWPQVMYAGLGFAPVGRQVAVTRHAPTPAGSG